MRGRLPLGRGSHVDVGHFLRILLTVDVKVELGGQPVRAIGDGGAEGDRSPGSIVSEGLRDPQQMISFLLGPVIKVGGVLHKILEPGFHSKVLFS